MVRERRARRGQFRLRQATFRGEGLQPDLSAGAWDAIRARIYEGRGG